MALERSRRSHFWVLGSRFVFRFGSNFWVRASGFEVRDRDRCTGFGVPTLGFCPSANPEPRTANPEPLNPEPNLNTNRAEKNPEA
jgi:hypothetical protein